MVIYKSDGTYFQAKQIAITFRIDTSVRKLSFQKGMIWLVVYGMLFLG